MPGGSQDRLSRQGQDLHSATIRALSSLRAYGLIRKGGESEVFELFEIGGCIRDRLSEPPMPSKDIDFTVVEVNPPNDDADESFARLRSWLNSEGFTIFVEHPEHFTIRAKFPKRIARDKGTQDADFVLARVEGPYTDGRRPDWVKIGTLHDDQLRRDFRCNSVAMTIDGEIIDPFGGIADIKSRSLVCVGSALERFTEDALRALRAIRFRITKGFSWDEGIRAAMTSSWLPPLLPNVSHEVMRDELEKCFKVSSVDTLSILSHETSEEFLEAIFGGDLRLSATMKG